MRPGRALAGRLVVILVVGSSLTGCGHGATDSTHPAAARAGTSRVVAAVDPACDPVETLFEQMRVQAGSWSPQLRPFDKAMIDRVRNLAEQLSTEQRKARETDLRNLLARNIKALNTLGMAMTRGKSESSVLSAVREMQAAYAPLKGVCRINGAVPSTTTKSKVGSSPSAQPKVSPGVSSARGPACAGAQRVFTRMAAVSAAWSPQRHPFDSATARKTRALGQRLATLAAASQSPRVRTQVRATAMSLEGISTAMDSRRRTRVYDALGKAQLAYGRLRVACSLG
jgi:hypothetical protein